MGVSRMTDEEKDLIQRAQDIQSYIENRCNTLEEKIAKLEKENEELKAQIKCIRMEKGVLEAKLKTYEQLWEEQQRVIKEKSAQIEKMKCCENCKHNIIGKCAELYCQECSYYGVPNQNIDKWELKNE